MKKIIASALSMLSAIACAVAQIPNDANVVGHVIDKRSKDHIPYAAVTIKGTTYGVSTDATGHYFMKNIPDGDYLFEVSVLGYISTQKRVKVNSHSTAEVNFELAEDVMAMEQVVVSASRTSVIRKNSPSLVNVVTSKTLDMATASSLADGLVFQPGVRVEDNCQNCGFTQVRINGLDGHYSQILIDSRPIFSALTGVYGLEQIPANMIDRVEVVRGGGSALFGSSAIGGTVNIITKDPTYSSAEVNHTVMAIGMTGALDNNTSANVSLVSDNNKIGMLVYGQVRSRDGYDRNGDGFTEIPLLDNHTLGMRAFLKTGRRSRLTLQYSGLNEFRRGGNNLRLPAHEADITEQTEHNINNGAADFNLFSADHSRKLNVYSSFQNTARKSYYGSGCDPNAYGMTDDLVAVGGAQYTRLMENLWFMPAEFIAGVEYNHNKLVDESAGYDHYVRQNIHILSAYAQNEWRNDSFGLLVGARIDKHNLIAKPVLSPRINLRYNPTEGVNLRATFSTGFRAPQAFDEDFHIAVVGGERVVTVLSDDLRQENSRSISLSADIYRNIGAVQTNFLVEAFYTDLSDVFALRRLDLLDEKGNQVLERYNGSGAVVKGVTIEAKAAFGSPWQMQAGLTLQRSRYKEPEQWSENPEVAPATDMFRTPNVYGYLTSYITPVKRINISVTGTYTGAMTVQHMEGSGTTVDMAVRTPDFFDLNIKAAYRFNLAGLGGLQLYVGVNNVSDAYQKDFDSGQLRDSGYIYGPSLPRSFYAGVKLEF